MAQQWRYTRTIVEEAAAEVSVNGYSRHFARFDDAFGALKWLLSRKCDGIGALKKTVEGVTYYLYTQDQDDFASSPIITVLYRFDNEHVYIEGVLATPPN